MKISGDISLNDTVPKPNDFNMSHISFLPNATIREQPSQLDIKMNGNLHSTFNYPLHSTMNCMDISLDISTTFSDENRHHRDSPNNNSPGNHSDSLVDSKCTMKSHNINVIGGSTVNSDIRSDNSNTTQTPISPVNQDCEINSKHCATSQSQARLTSDGDQPSGESATTVKCYTTLNQSNRQYKQDSVRLIRDKSQELKSCVNKTGHHENKQVPTAQRVGIQPIISISRDPKQPEKSPPVLTEELLKTFNEKMQQTENWVHRHVDLKWTTADPGEESDANSSFLSFDVDDATVSLDDTIAHQRNISPRDAPVSQTECEQAKINNNRVPCIDEVISQHLWGTGNNSKSSAAQELIDSIEGSCSVCKLLRLKRQQGCSDLWSDASDSHPPGTSKQIDSAFANGTMRPCSSMSFMDQLAHAHEEMHDRVSIQRKRARQNVDDVNFSVTPKRRYTLPAGVYTNEASTGSRTHTKHSSSRRQREYRRKSQVVKTREDDGYLRPIDVNIMQRLEPEGCDDKENMGPACAIPSSALLGNTNQVGERRRDSKNRAQVVYSDKNCDTLPKRSKYNENFFLAQRNGVVKSTIIENDVGVNEKQPQSALLYDVIACAPSCFRSEKRRKTMHQTPKSKKATSEFPSVNGQRYSKNDAKRKLKSLSRSLQNNKENVQIHSLGCL